MIEVDVAKCTGCRMCEVACSLQHTGEVNRSESRIKVMNIYEEGLDGPVTCAQCKERYCIDVCPEDALSVGSHGQVNVSLEDCTLCGACEKACPTGAIEIFEDTPYVCDLCGGEPSCVEECTENAVTYKPDKSEVLSLSKIKDEVGGMNPSEKRRNYVCKKRKW